MAVNAELKKRLLELLKSDEELRLAVAGLLGFSEILKRLDKHEEELEKLWKSVEKLREDFLVFVKEQERRWEENNRRWEENWRKWEENNRRWEENWKRWEENEKRWEEAFKRFEAIERTLMEHTKILEEHTRILQEHTATLKEHGKRLEELSRAVARVEVTLGRLGGRWGRNMEALVFEIFREVLEERGIAPGRVERFEYVDRDGRFYKRGARIEVDMYVHNEKLYLMEVKSLAEYEDVEHFHDKAQIVENIIGRKADKLILIAVNITEDALKRAKELGIDVICGAVITL